jgi:hypothetical protein
METHGRSVRFAGGTPGRGDHICAFFNSIDEQHRVLGWFIEDGFDGGDKAFHHVDPEQREAHLKRLAEAEINVQEAMGTGQYVVAKYDDAVICAYDLPKFGASVVMDALRTHPMVIIGALLHENPLFVPPDRFLLELRERRSVRETASVAR